jgi:hypothetical protein
LQKKAKSRGSLCSGLREILLSLLQGVNERLPRPTQGETIFPVHVVRVELDLYHFPHEQSRPESKEHIRISGLTIWRNPPLQNIV